MNYLIKVEANKEITSRVESSQLISGWTVVTTAEYNKVKPGICFDNGKPMQEYVSGKVTDILESTQYPTADKIVYERTLKHAALINNAKANFLKDDYATIKTSYQTKKTSLNAETDLTKIKNFDTGI